jgi:hypothetical protein
LAELSNLRELQLGGNLFGGKIPRSMGKLHNLFYGLNLSSNGLIGDIPSKIGKLGLLQSLDISLNNLSGSIDAPTEMKLPDVHDRVLEATENLNGQYIIGRGAHGIVYKAIVYRRVCAVKKVEFGRNKQKWLSIMHNEIKVLRMLRHRNLIKYCNHWIGNDYGLVIYKFIENGSLYNILHVKKPPPPLTWNVRFNIAFGIAQGLAYLHYDCVPPILHRDIKPENILVDENLEPIIADFGTALCTKLFEDSYSHSETKKMLSAHVVGTPGYIAPGNLLFIHNYYGFSPPFH